MEKLFSNNVLNDLLEIKQNNCRRVFMQKPNKSMLDKIE